MTLALARSFIDSDEKYNHTLAIKFFVAWKYQGRFSSSTSAWDVGGSTRKALAVWKDDGWTDVERTQLAITQKLDKQECSGNGSLMRISPIGVALWRDPDAAVLTARQHSLPTHPFLACVEACAAFTKLICQAMRGMSFPSAVCLDSNVLAGDAKEQLCQTIATFTFTDPALAERFARYKTIDDWKAKTRSDISSSGWVVDTLEVALWGFFKYDKWADGALAVVNLGGDADTAGAVYGGLAGVFYGVEAIPEKWVNGMQKPELIREISGKFADMVPP